MPVCFSRKRGKEGEQRISVYWSENVALRCVALCRAVANFAMTFSVVSVLTGLTTLYGTGLEDGGPATMVYGWLLVGAMTMVVGLSMAEICSAFPTSGGLYFWSAKLCGSRWGPLASWLTGWCVPLSFTSSFFFSWFVLSCFYFLFLIKYKIYFLIIFKLQSTLNFIFNCDVCLYKR